MFLPTRDSSMVDLVANSGGALAGGLLAAWLARYAPVAGLYALRARAFLPAHLGDVGIALLALWLTWRR